MCLGKVYDLKVEPVLKLKIYNDYYNYFYMFITNLTCGFFSKRKMRNKAHIVFRAGSYYA